MANKANASLFVEHLRKSGITCLYHFTSRRNLDSIKRHGGLYSWWDLDTHGITVPCPGGNDFSKLLDRYNGLQD